MALSSVWLNRMRGITGAELLYLLEAQFYLGLGELARLVRPKGELVRGVQDLSTTVEAPAQREVVISELRAAAVVGWAVTRAARYGIVRSQCLVRSLAIQRMLKRRGIRGSELKIGVRVENGKLLAHAWVQLHGAVVGDSVGYVSTFQSAPDLKLVQL